MKEQIDQDLDKLLEVIEQDIEQNINIREFPMELYNRLKSLVRDEEANIDYAPSDEGSECV